jgi:hypothetical protein
MDFENIILAVITKLQALKIFDQVEEYDGQFETVEEFEILPPAAFVEIEEDNNVSKNQVEEEVSLAIYLVSSKLSGVTSGIYALRTKVRDDFKLASISMDSKHLCTSVYDGSQNFINLPGMKTWKLKFTLK